MEYKTQKKYLNFQVMIMTVGRYHMQIRTTFLSWNCNALCATVLVGKDVCKDFFLAKCAPNKKYTIEYGYWATLEYDRAHFFILKDIHDHDKKGEAPKDRKRGLRDHSGEQ